MKPAHARILLLCVMVLGLGCPPLQAKLNSLTTSNPVSRFLVALLTVPAWYETDYDYSARMRWSLVASIAVLLLGIVLLIPYALRRAATVRDRWGAALLAGTLTGVLSYTAFYAVIAEIGFEGFANYYLAASIAFGAVLGLLALLLRVEAGAASAARTRFRWPAYRTPGRRGDMTRPADETRVGIAREPGDVTRYLCAAAYTDPGFAKLVVEDVLADELGAIACSPGVDLVPVAQHCLTARKLRFTRDQGLAVVFAAMLLVAPLSLLLGALFMLVLGSATVQFGSPDHANRGRGAASPPRAFAQIAITAVAAFAVLIPITVALVTATLPGPFAWLFGTYLYGIPLLSALLVGVPFAYVIAVRCELEFDKRMRGLRREDFSPTAPFEPTLAAHWAQRRLRALADAQRGNVTVYGRWAPVQGFGTANESWSIGVPLLPPAGPVRDGNAVDEFTTWDAVSYLKQHLRDLSASHQAAPPVNGEPNLAGLFLEDRVFVHGSTIRDDPRFLPERGQAPVTSLSEEEVRRVALTPAGTARHSLGVHLPLWGGDVAPSVFLHVVATGATLHVRFESYILEPVHAGYHLVDVLPATPTPHSLRAVRLRALRETSWSLLAAPAAALHQARFDRRHARELSEQRLVAHQDPFFNYGARLSIRESAVGPRYANYFQTVDRDQVVAAISRHTLAAIRDFLDLHGVDTAIFNQQQQTILNHGIIQQGGVSVVNNQAVGQGASISAAGEADQPAAAAK